MPLRTNRIYLAIAKFIDWDVRKNPRPISLIIAILPAIAAIFASQNGVSGGVFYWPLAISLSLGVFGFLVWRMVRWAFISTGKKADWRYDQETKYKLPPEYADTMSAAEARRQRKRKRNEAS